MIATLARSAGGDRQTRRAPAGAPLPGAGDRRVESIESGSTDHLIAGGRDGLDDSVAPAPGGAQRRAALIGGARRRQDAKRDGVVALRVRLLLLHDRLGDREQR